jgi:hypothetical protein
MKPLGTKHVNGLSYHNEGGNFIITLYPYIYWETMFKSKQNEKRYCKGTLLIVWPEGLHKKLPPKFENKLYR